MWKFGNNFLHSLEKPFIASTNSVTIHFAGLHYCWPKEPLDSSEWPEDKERRLRIVEKQPKFNYKPPKMFKMIKLMRGPEPVHNELLYKGFGVKALLGGRMKFEHFEAVRKIVNPNIDISRMFAVWRIDDPWQPLTKKGIGKTLGGGKGPIHHYCTPVKANRIIVELGGDLHELEAKRILTSVAEVLPFPSRFVTQKDLEDEKEAEKWVLENNLNPYDMEYVIQNNMGGCKKWLSKYDYMWFGRYK